MARRHNPEQGPDALFKAIEEKVTRERWPFGRPVSLLGGVEEQERQKQQVIDLVRHAQKVAVNYLGFDAAKSIWKQEEPKKKEGRPKGSTSPQRDEIILECYDLIYEESTDEEKIRIVAIVADKLFSFQQENIERQPFGSSKDAIEKTIRRLLKKRQELEAQQNAQTVQRPPKTSLLGDA